MLLLFTSHAGKTLKNADLKLASTVSKTFN